MLFKLCWTITVLPRLLVQCGALPLSGPRGSNQIIWSDPVEWNGVREGQPVALCFSLRSNVIRAQWERHGLDCNPPESLPPPALWFVCTTPLSVSDSSGPWSPSETQSIKLLLPFNLNTLLGFSYSLFQPSSLLVICPLDLLTLSVSLWLGVLFWSVPMFWSLSTMVLLTFSLNDSDWKSPHI